MELIHPRPLRRSDLMTFHYKTTVFSVTEITELDHKDFPNEHKYISTKTEKVIPHPPPASFKKKKVTLHNTFLDRCD